MAKKEGWTRRKDRKKGQWIEKRRRMRYKEVSPLTRGTIENRKSAITLWLH
jgi:hypothetical protein